MELGVSMGLGESGKMALAHKNHDSKAGVSKKSNYIAAEYSIGAMTAYLGFAQHKTQNNEATARGKIAGAKFNRYDEAESTVLGYALPSRPKVTMLPRTLVLQLQPMLLQNLQ